MLVVGDIENGSRGTTIDQFDAKDLGLRKGGTDLDGKVRCLAVIFRVGGDLVQLLGLRNSQNGSFVQVVCPPYLNAVG